MIAQRFERPTNLEKLGFEHPKKPLLRDWRGRQKWVEEALKTYKPTRLLSHNTKTDDPSLNLPILGHCLNKTERCETACYALTGPIAMSVSVLKQEYLSRYLRQANDLRQLIGECSVVKSVRLNGGGDLLPAHVPAIIKLAKACKETIFWGMSKNLDVLRLINTAGLPNLSLLLSVDGTTPKSIIENYTGAFVWGPALPGDKIPFGDKRLKVVFPYHQGGKVRDPNMPKTHLDCRAITNKELHCNQCRRCWNARPFNR